MSSFAKNTGMIIIGGGLVKHHICNANLMVGMKNLFTILLALHFYVFFELWPFLKFLRSFIHSCFICHSKIYISVGVIFPGKIFHHMAQPGRSWFKLYSTLLWFLAFNWLCELFITWWKEVIKLVIWYFIETFFWLSEKRRRFQCFHQHGTRVWWFWCWGKARRSNLMGKDQKNCISC